MEALPITTAFEAKGDVPLPPETHATPLPPAPDNWSRAFAQSLQQQHGRVRAFLDAQRERWAQAETVLRSRIETLEAEADKLRITCAELRDQAESRASDGESRNSDADERYETLLTENRDLQERIADLRKQVGRSRKGPEVIEIARPKSVSSWEDEKQRILAELESDDERNTPDTKDYAAKIEEIVRRTDSIIAEKDREIEELQHLLETQSNSLGSMAVGAAALDQILDHDAIVREEREQLKLLQEQCREKLRHAEVEIALERAKIARKQAEVDDKIRMMDLRGGPNESSTDAQSRTGRPIRGRWLARLGLSDPDEGKGKSGGKK